MLSGADIRLIRHDFLELLHSPGAQRVALKWQSGHTGTWNEAYRRWEGGEPIYQKKTNVPALIQIVQPTDTLVLELGLVSVGDAIFHFDLSIDLDLPELVFIQNYDSLDPEGSGQITWYPIPLGREVSDLQTVLLGPTQLCQVVLASRVKRR